MRQPTSDLRIRTARPLLSPAILEEDYFTALIPAGWTLTVSEAGDVILDREE